MKSINTYFTTNDNLKNLINYNNFSNSKSLLIQIFISFNDPVKIKKLLFFIREILPNAVVIGSTTDGEIMNGKVSTNEIVINFTEFESTTLEFASIVHEDDGYFSGKYLAHRLISEDTKLLIAFGDGLYTNGESFLNGINEVNSDIIIAGGLAGDRATFTSTYVFTQDAIIVKGAVAVALNSKKLHVNTDYSFNWQTIGKELIITEAKANRVYSIDNQKAIDVYSHYLGDHIVENLPELGIEFPLIVNRNGMNIARAMLAKEEDGSLIFAGNLNVGDKVRFGYGNSKDILRQSNKMFERVQQHPSEAIFTYSCMARRHFMSHDIESEILPLQDIAPVSGFFTYGEFFNCVKNELLNQTMTLLSLSEDEVIDTNVKYQKRDETSDSSSLGILVHLVNATSREVEDQNRKLQKQKISFETLFEKSSDGVLIIEDGKFIQCNGKIVEMLHYDSKEDILNLHPSQLSPEFQPDGKSSYDKAQEMMNQAFESGGHIFEWMHTRSDGENFWAEIVLTPISLEDRDVIHVVWRDISKRKDMESKLQSYTDELELRVEDEVKKNKFQQQKLFDQSRMAQMGEMISMIAHQWRQPLGAISATAIDLKMQMMLNSFDLDEDEDREKCKIYFDSRLDDIGTFVQNLTNTIDDFRNFYKPNKESKELLMREPIMKALNIVRASFEAEGIEMIESYSSATKIKIHENEMMQVILNILKNAQDNFKEKDIREAQINIITKDIDHKTIIEISDNGGGINEDILPNIFDPYFSTKSEKNGTGLGLYMSKMIVEEHHEGNLSVENRDNGVCFIIKI